MTLYEGEFGVKLLPPKKMIAVSIAASLVLVACGNAGPQGKQGAKVERETPAFQSTYTPLPSQTTAIIGATILDGIGGQLDQATIIMQDGKILAFGAEVDIPDGAVRIDGTGKWVTPGIVDTHSHLGVYPSPGTASHSDGNEIGEPITTDVWVEHSNWPQDPGFVRAAAGGVTALQLLPGSANLAGGRSVTLKNVPGRLSTDMKFPGAPYGEKFACGENPKRVYGTGQNNPTLYRPYTRMGNVAGVRQAFAEAEDYKRRWDAYDRDYDAGLNAIPPKRDLKLDTLVGIMEGDIKVHTHCYRADDMGSFMGIAEEFGFQIASFHHAVESYKIADLLAERGICSSMWADWWGFKMEAYDGIRENIPMVHKAGACAIVHSDQQLGIQRLNQEAAKAWSDGKRAGIDISMAEAWTWLSLNPAKSLGIDRQTGSLEPGKDADIVLWSGNPFSVYTNAELTFVDGAVIWDRNQPDRSVMDFELGQPGAGELK